MSLIKEGEGINEKIELCAYQPYGEELIKLGERDAGRLREIQRLRLAEWHNIEASFLRFLKWCKILTTPTQFTPNRIIPFEFPPHLQTLMAAYLSKKLISIMKSRQVWVSYFTAAYALWFAMTKVGANILLFSKGEQTAFELLGKAYRIYEQLPPFMKLTLNPSSRGEMGIPVRTSSIKALPSTETSGIGETASVVVCDEHDEHPYAIENYNTVKPTIDTSGGQFISIFTPRQKNQNSLAFTIFRDALEGRNDFVPLFFPWQVVPGRSREWYDEVARNITTEELEGLSPELYMQGNYPASVEEALRPISTVSAFDHMVLDEMAEDTREPTKVAREGIDPKVVRIYKDFHLGEYYIAASDTSHGVGKDYNVTGVMNVRTGEVVADIMDNTISPEELALHTVRLLALYHNPLWYPEDNDWGRVAITTAQGLGYKNFGYMDEKKTKVGWHTDERSRLDLFGALIPGINNRQIKIYNVLGLRQLYGIIRNAEKSGRIEASSGKHDDYAIMLGICWLKRKEVQLEKWESKPLQTLTFRK